MKTENDIPKTGSDGYKQIISPLKKMKFFLSVARRGLIPLIAVGFLFVSIPKCLAEDDPIASVRPAAKAWLGMIDAGQYQESYSAAGQGLHQTTAQDRWILILKSLRPVWGPVTSRTEGKHVYQPNGITGLSGECMAIAYDTSFKNLPAAQELVILRFEDGKWRGVGYTAGPKPPPDPTAASPMDTPPVTQTQSEVHSLPGQPINKPTPATSHTH